MADVDLAAVFNVKFGGFVPLKRAFFFAGRLKPQVLNLSRNSSFADGVKRQAGKFR
jgi:hypothetical protein